MKQKQKMVKMEQLYPVLDELLRNNREINLTVTGDSMYPLLRHGADSVILVAPGNIKKYDVILHRRKDGKFVLHRLLKKKGDVLTIRGDNEKQKEYPVYSDQVIARVKGFYRGSRYIPAESRLYRLYSIVWSNAVALRWPMLCCAKTFIRWRRR